MSIAEMKWEIVRLLIQLRDEIVPEVYEQIKAIIAAEKHSQEND